MILYRHYESNTHKNITWKLFTNHKFRFCASLQHKNSVIKTTSRKVVLCNKD